MSKRVALLCGGTSGERDISLSSAAAVEEALRKKYEVFKIDTGKDGWATTLLELNVDGAFICLHGPVGEDGSIQGFCKSVGIPFTGSDVLASAVAMDKSVAKQLVGAFGVKTPDYICIHDDNYDAAHIAKTLGQKVVVKPATEGSALGVTIVEGLEELDKAVHAALSLSSSVLIERFVSGKELTAAVLGGKNPQALPIIEIVPANEFYDFESKYEQGMAQHICPARLTDEESATCGKLALAAHQALGCYSVSRSDFILDDDGNLWYLETNTIPGMTGTSLLPDAAKAVGMGFDELCWLIMEDAWNRC
jgi:D-alanine-D-alanine ligase